MCRRSVRGSDVRDDMPNPVEVTGDASLSGKRFGFVDGVLDQVKKERAPVLTSPSGTAAWTMKREVFLLKRPVLTPVKSVGSSRPLTL